ncbi:MAG: family 20 glycosylhydrolase [bacterium]
MNQKIIISFIILGLSVLGMIQCSKKQQNDVSIIPKPVHSSIKKGNFIISPDTKIVIDSASAKIRYAVDFFNNLLAKSSNYRLNVVTLEDKKVEDNTIVCTTKEGGSELGAEGYTLSVKKNGIHIKANTAKGIFYGIQTLRQLLPVEMEASIQSENRQEWSVPLVKIKDEPRFPYRGMHLDVCRHFMPKEFIKKYIDYIAMHKMNTFHWHLTEDQGWRIEIKKYPRLTEIGAWREETLKGDLNNLPRKFDGKRYGGYYTQEEIKEIVAYANSRFVTIIPEIEMPGHSLAALAAYPEISCTGGPFEVRTTWGISQDVYCAGKEKTFKFLENVLSEVIELFPSRYIHIGGDECPKERWKNCPDCQTRIRENNLKDEHELQSYFIQRIEKFLNSKGRFLIGWDEILEGGLAPEATVMSWRGMEGGIAAAQQGHDVIMTPTSHCYFDYYQGEPDFEPKAIGGYTPLKKVYSFNPIPDILSEKEKRHILGAQGNVWTEYISGPDQVEYMAIPRMAALAEVVWSPPEKREWHDFLDRMGYQLKRYKKLGINFAKSAFNVYPVSEIDTMDNSLKVSFETELIQPEIRFTLDGSDPDRLSKPYSSPFELNKTTLVKAGIFKEGILRGDITERLFHIHKAVARPIRVAPEPDSEYGRSQTDKTILIDGMKGTVNFRNGLWTAFSKDDFQAIIDLGTIKSVHKIATGFLVSTGYSIFLPFSVAYQISEDQKTFTTVAEKEYGVPENHIRTDIEDFVGEFNDINARYIKVIARNIKTCPHWHSSSGEPALLLVDEVMVE